MKIGLAQINVIPGQPEINTKKMVAMINEAKSERIDILVFPELGLPGYLLSDLWEDDTFIKSSFILGDEIKKASSGINVIFGNVLPDFRQSLFNKDRKEYGNDGRTKKYNAAYVYSNGTAAKQVKELPQYCGCDIFPVKGVTIKTLQPHYREFEDARHFVSFKQLSQQIGMRMEDLLQPFELNIKDENGEDKIVKAGVLICEDIWIYDYVYHGKTLNPAEILVNNGAEIIIALSTSPYGWRKNLAREKNVWRVQKRLAEIDKPTPVVYLNPVGMQNNGKNEYILDGRSAIYNSASKLVYEAPLCKEGIFSYDLKIEHEGIVPEFELPKITKKSEREELHQALIYGIKEFCKQKGVENIVIGMSGGIDSAIVAYLAVQAIGKEHVFGVNLPTKFNSDWTKSTAKYVADRLGMPYQVVAVEDLSNVIREKIANVQFNGNFGIYGPDKKDRVVDENIQARTRIADIISGIAAKYPKTIYTCNGNKTELLFGWFTLDGDGRGAICPIGDLYKTHVIDLAIHINEISRENAEDIIFPWELLAPLYDPVRYLEVNEEPREVIPANTKILVPSAELSAEQDVNQEKGDPIIFEYHDYLLRQLVEYRKNPQDIIKAYDDGGIKGLAQQLEINPNKLESIFKKHFPQREIWEKDLQKVWRAFHVAIYKQIQAPPILSISKRALGYDFRRSQLSAYTPSEKF